MEEADPEDVDIAITSVSSSFSFLQSSAQPSCKLQVNGCLDSCSFLLSIDKTALLLLSC